MGKILIFCSQCRKLICTADLNCIFRSHPPCWALVLITMISTCRIFTIPAVWIGELVCISNIQMQRNILWYFWDEENFWIQAVIREETWDTNLKHWRENLRQHCLVGYNYSLKLSYSGGLTALVILFLFTPLEFDVRSVLYFRQSMIMSVAVIWKIFWVLLGNSVLHISSDSSYVVPLFLLLHTVEKKINVFISETS